MSDSSTETAAHLPEEMAQALSAAADGEATATEWEMLLAAWPTAPALREAWSGHHRIGECLRSEDAMTGGLDDEAFLAVLRVRLAAEPVPLAPAAVQPVTVSAAPREDSRTEAWIERGRRAWGYTGLAVAALMAVAVLIGQDRWQPDSSLLSRLAPKHGVLQLETASLVTDPRLDALLQAHQSVSGRRGPLDPAGDVRPADWPESPPTPGGASRSAASAP